MHARDRSPLLQSAAALIIALCLYIGLYVHLCVPPSLIKTSREFSIGSTFISPGYSTTYLPLSYKAGGHLSKIIFLPLQKIDQRFFPGRWPVPPAPPASSLP